MCLLWLKCVEEDYLSSRSSIESALQRLSRGVGRATSRRLGTWYLSALLFALGVGLLLAQLGWARAGLGWMVLTGLAGAVAWVWLLRRFVPRHELATARVAESLAPELGTAATSAVDLAQRIAADETPFSTDLAELHLDRTAKRIDDIDLADRLRLRDRTPRHRTWALLGASLLWALFLVLLLDSGRARLFTLLTDPNAAQMSDLPLAGDIQITYRYPAYTGLEPRVIEGGDGSVTAVAGTEVEIHAVADRSVDSALLRVTQQNGTPLQDIPLAIDDERELSGRFSILRDAAYHFALEDTDGDRLEERQSHPIRATLDAYPEIHMDAPAGDVELKDDQTVDVLWRAKDDFGVAEVTLVIEKPGSDEPQRIKLTPEGAAEARREGRYRWSVAEIDLPSGVETTFFLEALDNDVLGGPKRSVSATRKLSLFSARKHHEGLLAQQREFLDAMVDWLGEDLTQRFPPQGGSEAVAAQERIVARMERIDEQGAALVLALREDKLTKPEIATAFENLREHVETAARERGRAVAVAKRPTSNRWAFTRLATLQTKAVTQLEKDIIYLDDLLALQRIDELKETAKDLLAAQRSLQEMLNTYRETQDPSLKAALEQQIRELRQQMVDLLAKMSQIKEGLPSEYRNMEAASMLKLDDQLDRLEQMLKEGNLEDAAKELEQLANMLENMVNSINEAEEQFGGERYAELREQLGEFADEFKQLESQQKALSERADELLKKYRKEAVKRAGKNLEQFVEKARKKTAEALQALDEVSDKQEKLKARPMASNLERTTEQARQRLLDLDALLESKDFAEARDAARLAEAHAQAVERTTEQMRRMSGSKPPRAMREAQDNAEVASERSGEVSDMLDKLFPDLSEVLTPEQLAQMRRMAQKQQGLQQKAGELGQKMEELAGEMPLFGGEPRQSLQQAQGEMGQAVGSIQMGELPGAARHKRRAAEQLGKLRESLEQASKGGQGGMPLPLGGSGSGRGRRGTNGDLNRDEVEIPQEDCNRADPRFRQELLEAAKQKAPERYEEAVRRYYEELIR